MKNEGAGRHGRRTERRGRPHQRPPGGSSSPAAAAARTSILSRRLPGLAFHDVAPDRVRSALASLGSAAAPWDLSKVSLYAAESLGQRVVTGAAGEEYTCLQLSNAYVLSLEISCYDWFKHSQLNFVQQIEKHLVTHFSVLDLTIQYDNGYERCERHVFGPCVLRLLGMHRIRQMHISQKLCADMIDLYCTDQRHYLTFKVSSQRCGGATG